MPSFDIASKVDQQTMDNAMNVAKKDILNRFDFKGTQSEINFDKKANTITILTENEMRMESIIDTIRNRMIKQQLDPRCLDEGKAIEASGMMIRKVITVKTGIDKEASKKIMKDIKDSKIKVSAQVMDDIIRVSSKKIDDLQGVISLLRKGNYELPLQFINMK